MILPNTQFIFLQQFFDFDWTAIFGGLLLATITRCVEMLSAAEPNRGTAQKLNALQLKAIIRINLNLIATSMPGLGGSAFRTLRFLDFGLNVKVI